MKLQSPAFHSLVPDGLPLSEALSRITHLGIGAHQDDLEIMTFHGIATCLGKADQWFGGITCTNGAGSARSGQYAGVSNSEMIALRREEQDRAATLGQYGAMLQLGLSSAEIKSPVSPLIPDLTEILSQTRPEIVYTHNPADKHDTHLAVFHATLTAIRSLPMGKRPRRLLGCEVWRDLDWLADEDKVRLDLGGHGDLQQRLIACFVSQTDGGKRYELAAPGRALANATFFAARETDHATAVWHAMDLTPLILDDSLNPAEFVAAHLQKFQTDVMDRLQRFSA
ncbi:MAG: PIG-L family deacetylase [Chthoniobacteraceae bacterium]